MFEGNNKDTNMSIGVVLYFFSFTNVHDSHDSKGGGRLFDSSLPLPPASQTFRHKSGDYCRELTSAYC